MLLVRANKVAIAAAGVCTGIGGNKPINIPQKNN